MNVTRTVVVTGAAQGVGFATSTLLAQQGWHVVLTDLQPLDTALGKLRAAGHSVDELSGDVSSEAFVKTLADHVATTRGAADALVNNAGISIQKALNVASIKLKLQCYAKH